MLGIRLAYLHICILDYPPEILYHADPWRRSRVEPSESVRRENDLIIVLNEQIEHVRDEDDEVVR